MSNQLSSTSLNDSIEQQFDLNLILPKLVERVLSEIDSTFLLSSIDNEQFASSTTTKLSFDNDSHFVRFVEAKFVVKRKIVDFEAKLDSSIVELKSMTLLKYCIEKLERLSLFLENIIEKMLENTSNLPRIVKLGEKYDFTKKVRSLIF
jgi:hypothetical protein